MYIRCGLLALCAIVWIAVQQEDLSTPIPVYADQIAVGQKGERREPYLAKYRLILEEPEEVPEKEEPAEEEPEGFEPLELPLPEELQLHAWELCGSYSSYLEQDELFQLLLAVMWVESGLDPQVSDNHNGNGTVDRGLMQINSSMWPYLREQGLDVSDPKDNLEAGLVFLSDYLDRYEDAAYALTAYNMGPTGAKRREGRSAYAERVLELVEAAEQSPPWQAASAA